jgi:hypothetical protein
MDYLLENPLERPRLTLLVQGWELRLAAVIDEARWKPYQLGEHDCFRFACQAVEALTGVDLYAPWRGAYRTKRQALRLLARYGGGFTGSFTRLFGAPPISIGLARRGDIAEFVDAAGEQHLGVVNGALVVILREKGLDAIRRSNCAHAWRIG